MTGVKGAGNGGRAINIFPGASEPRTLLLARAGSCDKLVVLCSAGNKKKRRGVGRQLCWEDDAGTGVGLAQ